MQNDNVLNRLVIKMKGERTVKIPKKYEVTAVSLNCNTAAQQTSPISTSPDPLSHAGIRSVLGFLDDFDQTLENVGVGGRRAGNADGSQVLPSSSVGNIVQTVHGIDGGTLVEEVNQDKGRLAAIVFLLAFGCCVAKVSGSSRRRIGGRNVADVGILNVQCLLVEEMVHEWEAVGRQGGGKLVLDARGTIGLTGEVGSGGHVVVVLPDKSELIHQIWCHRVAGSVQRCHEGHQPGTIIDQFLQCWPRARCGGLGGWCVGVVGEIGRFELRMQIRSCCIV